MTACMITRVAAPVFGAPVRAAALHLRPGGAQTRQQGHHDDRVLHGFAKSLNFGNATIGTNDPEDQEKYIKFTFV